MEVGSRRIIWTSLLVVTLLCACTRSHNHPQDPYENYNRSVFKFNKAIDKAIYKPVAKVYKTITPTPIYKASGNFFNNLRQIPTVVNFVLQGELKDAMLGTWRFVLNSTVGIGGLMDVAVNMGLPPHYSDFGITLARWGIKESPYFMLPFLGPSTLRDTVAWPIDGLMTVYPYINPAWVSWGLVGWRYVHLRAELLDAEGAISSAEFDEYEFLRDAYLQRRAYLMRDDLSQPSVDYVEEEEVNT